MRFQGTNSIAGIRKGYVNWTDTGVKDLNTSFTIMAWARYEAGRPRGAIFQSGGVNADGRPGGLMLEHLFFANLPFAGWIELPPTHPNYTMSRKEDWHHFAIVVEDGTTKQYLNGTLGRVYLWKAWGLMPEAYNMQIESATFHLGGRYMSGVKGPIKQPLIADGLTPIGSRFIGFQGTMDDFQIRSRALDQTEIQDAMKAPQDPSNIPSDMPIYYNFDVLGCDSSATTNLFEDPNCDIVGNGIITNYGTAGSDYDLLVGQINDDYGFGKKWVKAGTEHLDLPVTYDFDKPTPCLDTPPVFETKTDLASLPSNVQLLPGNSVTLVFPSGHTPFQVVKPPIIGNLTLGSDNATILSEGGDISAEDTLRYFAPTGMNAPIQIIISVKESAVEKTHVIIVWPFFKPQIVEHAEGKVKGKHIIQYTTLEDQPERMYLKDYMYSATGEDLEARVLSVSTSQVRVLQRSVVELLWNGLRAAALFPIALENNTLQNRAGLNLYLTPFGGFFGYMRVVYEYYSPASGLVSDPMTMELKVVLVDDLPTSVANNATEILEDNSTGVVMDLEGTDQEMLFGLYQTIETLPTKGKLFKIEQDGNESEILLPHNPVESGVALQQYVSNIRAVSSFSQRSTIIQGHPLNLIGPPACKWLGNNKANDCSSGRSWQTGKADRDSWIQDIPTGILVTIDIYGHQSILADPLMKPLRAYAWVTEKIGQGKLANYTVKVLPTYKYVNGKAIQCIMHRGPSRLDEVSYPEHCDETIVPEGDFIIHNVTQFDGIVDSQARYWKPSNPNLVPGMFTGGDLSAMFGSKYRWTHNSMDTYVQANDPKYSEFRMDRGRV
uniref:Uncharacterized protein n=1 Tax=Mucochytrium quahogii TaxID=96639 RepID=A0A7S2R959_9STRA|mmetsp:Transcript_2093/g.3860  ORF Transcript_2093/g.3860 Transcript_2093/m.3860 type:complete len:833 (+) Transcript_2093:322-2820(+)